MAFSGFKCVLHLIWNTFFPLHIFIIFEEMGKELKDLTMDSP